MACNELHIAPERSPTGDFTRPQHTEAFHDTRQGPSRGRQDAQQGTTTRAPSRDRTYGSTMIRDLKELRGCARRLPLVLVALARAGACAAIDCSPTSNGAQSETRRADGVLGDVTSIIIGTGASS